MKKNELKLVEFTSISEINSLHEDIKGLLINSLSKGGKVTLGIKVGQNVSPLRVKNATCIKTVKYNVDDNMLYFRYKRITY